jgi:hypothetical protein
MPSRVGIGRTWGTSLTLDGDHWSQKETPFLHIGTENVGAIRVYEKLDFNIRCIINFALVKESKP